MSSSEGGRPGLQLLLLAGLLLASYWQLSSALLLDGSAQSVDQLIAQWTAETQSLRAQRQLGATAGGLAASTKPNFVVIMTDDQDQLLNSTHHRYMPNLHNQIAKRGMQLRSFSVSTTVCCPSRVNFLTGQFSHNNNVTSNVQPNGGGRKFQTQKLDESYLPTWLQDEGYQTYFTGKWLNQFNPQDLHTTCPKGWDVFEPMVAPYVLDYYNTAFSLNCGPTDMIHNQYVTDVLLNKTLSYIGNASRHPDKPFLIVVAPTAPHDGCPPGVDIEDGDSCTSPPLPAPRHANLYPEVKVPRLSNWAKLPVEGTFNWVDFNNTNRGWNIPAMDEIYVARLRSLRAVDELLGATVSALEGLGLLDNTYVIFLSDNGYHIGSHGVRAGKLTAYEEDVRVPFFIRGPGIPEARISDYQATMCDVPATILDLAGGVQPWQVDGSPIPFKTLVDFQPRNFSSANNSTVTVQGVGQLDQPRDQVPVEMWVWGSDTRMTKRDYRALRVCTEYLAFGTPTQYRNAAARDSATFGFRPLSSVSYWAPKQDIATDTPRTCYKYVVWCTGTVELYDLMLDPGEINNRAPTAPMALMDRMDAYMTMQGFCHGLDCYHPYMALHPDGSVTRFAQTMNKAFNSIYAALPRFRFKSCTFYYHRENEVSWYNGTRAAGNTYPSISLPPRVVVPSPRPPSPSPPPPTQPPPSSSPPTRQPPPSPKAQPPPEADAIVDSPTNATPPFPPPSMTSSPGLDPPSAKPPCPIPPAPAVSATQPSEDSEDSTSADLSPDLNPSPSLVMVSSPPLLNSPPPYVASSPHPVALPPHLASPSPLLASPPPLVNSPPPLVDSSPHLVASPHPRVASPPPLLKGPPPRVASPLPDVTRPPPSPSPHSDSPPPQELQNELPPLQEPHEPPPSSQPPPLAQAAPDPAAKPPCHKPPPAPQA